MGSWPSHHHSMIKRGIQTTIKSHETHIFSWRDMGLKKFRYGCKLFARWVSKAHTRLIQPLYNPYTRLKHTIDKPFKGGLAYARPGWARGPWPKRGAAVARAD